MPKAQNTSCVGGNRYVCGLNETIQMLKEPKVQPALMQMAESSPAEELFPSCQLFTMKGGRGSIL